MSAAQARRADEAPAPLTLRPVRRGGEFTRQAVGGFVRDRAPVDGFAWETGDACGFIAERDVQTAVVDLKLAREGYRAGGRR